VEGVILMVLGVASGTVAGLFTILPYSIARTGRALPDVGAGSYLGVARHRRGNPRNRSGRRPAGDPDAGGGGGDPLSGVSPQASSRRGAGRPPFVARARWPPLVAGVRPGR
jgi:hypothetical protein